MQNSYENNGEKRNNLQDSYTLQKQAYIFGTLFLLANRLQVLGDALDDKITLKQWLFISLIIKSEKQSITVSELAKLIGTSRQNAKKMAVILEREGYIAFVKDETDARVLQVTLTEKCFEHFAKRNAFENEFIFKLFKGMDIDLVDKMAAGFSELLSNISEMENEIK